LAPASRLRALRELNIEPAPGNADIFGVEHLLEHIE
jgi:hypothetical protein